MGGDGGVRPIEIRKCVMSSAGYRGATGIHARHVQLGAQEAHGWLGAKLRGGHHWRRRREG